jgi:hypothetical protein
MFFTRAKPIVQLESLPENSRRAGVSSMIVTGRAIGRIVTKPRKSDEVPRTLARVA